MSATKSPVNWAVSLFMAWWKVQAAKKSERPEPSPQSPSPQNPSLPYDILLLIAELLDEQRLGRLIQTCRQLQILVEPILYRHIRVLRNRGWPAQNPLKSHFLHRTLVGRPDLLPVIRSYHGPLIPTANDAESITSSGPSKGVALWPFWHKTGTATRKPGLNDLDFVKRAKIIFSGATNIRELHFTDTIAKDTTQVFSALGAPRGSKTTNIQSLVLRIGIDSPQLTPILRMQPRLRHLELQLESYVPVRLDGTVLPELESLKAELRHAAEIVPGRPVKKLELLNDWTSYKDSLQRLALSTCGITEFITHITFLGTDYTIPDILIAPARYLQGIERLCFRLRGRAFGRTVSIPSPCRGDILFREIQCPNCTSGLIIPPLKKSFLKHFRNTAPSPTLSWLACLAIKRKSSPFPMSGSPPFPIPEPSSCVLLNG